MDALHRIRLLPAIPGALPVAAACLLETLLPVWYGFAGPARRDLRSWRGNARLDASDVADVYEHHALDLLECAGETSGSRAAEACAAAHWCQSAATDFRQKPGVSRTQAEWVDAADPAPNPWVVAPGDVLFTASDHPVDEHALWWMIEAVREGDRAGAQRHLLEILEMCDGFSRQEVLFLTLVTKSLRVAFQKDSGLLHLHTIRYQLPHLLRDRYAGDRWLQRVCDAVAVRVPEAGHG